jgi:ribonuclease HI
LRYSKQEFSDWLLQQQSHYLFFDGASRNNPGIAGAGGILGDPGGNRVIQFAWGLGLASNNLVEAYALWNGLRLAYEEGVRPMIILGDSMLVIRAILKKSDIRTLVNDQKFTRMRI